MTRITGGSMAGITISLHDQVCPHPVHGSQAGIQKGVLGWIAARA
jgi:hypothetical protein